MGVFIETGLTLMDCYPVVEKWLAECRLNQYPDGRMANIAPPTSRPGYMTPMLCMSAGWGDAAILVPYALYKRTGDRKILADNYEMMQSGMVSCWAVPSRPPKNSRPGHTPSTRC